MRVCEYIKDKVQAVAREYMEHSPDRFDFWKQLTRLVVRETLTLADEYGARFACWHKQDHHLNGVTIADRLLTEYGYPDDRKARVPGGVLCTA